MENTLHIVLVEPEIPQNTGNIARTCAALQAELHLIEPLGFSIEDKYVRRAGLDYWSDVRVMRHGSLEEYRRSYPEKTCYYISTKAREEYTQKEYGLNTALVFGKETKGLPEELLAANPEFCVRIPMAPGIRSLNLSNAVAVLAYEVMRQKKFDGLETRGAPTHFTWE